MNDQPPILNDPRRDTIVSSPPSKYPIEPSSALAGKSVVITRAMHQSEALATLLRNSGAKPLFYPCIEIAPPEDTTAIDNALRSIASFDWLILTSGNTVHALAKRLESLGLPLSLLAHLRTAAVGPATAQAARELLGLDAQLPSPTTPEEYSAEALAKTLQLPHGSQVLLPQSEIASPRLAESLTQHGALVQTVTAYRTIRGTGGDPIPQLLAHSKVDALIFTSGSTVQHFLGRLVDEGGSRSDLANLAIACIGESTAQAARDVDLTVAVIPQNSTLPELVRSLEMYFNA